MDSNGNQDRRLSNEEKYQKRLLYGLNKIRRMTNTDDQKVMISNFQRLRHRLNIDIYRAFLHFG